MAALQKTKIKGQAKKCSRGSRKAGDWMIKHRARDNRPGRELVTRANRDWPRMTDVGSAAYRRLLSKRSR
jgi:hypothetical protein